MEFLDVPIFDDDIYKMLVRLALNMFFLTIVIRFLFYKTSKKAVYIFTFYLIGLVVFFICFTLKKFELDIGMALGLFAIFGIIRYRTAPVDTKEMTYLFVVIGLSVINALSNRKMSYAELIAANVIIVCAVYIIEKALFERREKSMVLTYERIENIHFEDDTAFLADLKNRLGIEVTQYEIQRINYLRDSARILVYYKHRNNIDSKIQ